MVAFTRDRAVLDLNDRLFRAQYSSEMVMKYKGDLCAEQPSVRTAADDRFPPFVLTSATSLCAGYPKVKEKQSFKSPETKTRMMRRTTRSVRRTS